MRTPKFLAKEGKNTQKSKEVPAREKRKEFQKSKERKIRAYHWQSTFRKHVCEVLCWIWVVSPGNEQGEFTKKSWFQGNWGEAKVPPFLGVPPLSIKHPQDNVSLQNAKSRPPICKLARVISVNLYTKTADWRSPIYILEGADLHFGGCQFYILEADIVLGVVYRKGVIPKKCGTYFGFPREIVRNDKAQSFL